MKGRIKIVVRSLAAPVGAGLARLGITADAVTIAGVFVALAAAWGFFVAHRWLAFGALLASGLCDLLDGAVARARGGRGSPFGAALDSTLDRYGEGLIFGAILARLAHQDAAIWLLFVALLAGVGSFLVSYVRARSEGLGISCEVGWLERPERLFLLLALALWGDDGRVWILGALAVLTHVTFAQRLARIHREAARLAANPDGVE